MPTIPEYRSQVQLPGSISVSGNAADAFGVDAEGVGRQFVAEADRLKTKIENDDISNAQLTLIKAQSEWEQHSLERQKNAKLGDLGYVDSFKKDIDAYIAKTRETVTTVKGQQAYDKMAAQMRTGFIVDAAKFQAKSVAEKASLDFTELTSSLNNAVSTNPEKYEALLATGREALASGRYAGLPEGVREKLRKSFDSDITTAFIESRLLGTHTGGNIDSIIKELKSGKYNDVLDGKELPRFMKLAQAQKEHLDRVALVEEQKAEIAVGRAASADVAKWLFQISNREPGASTAAMQIDLDRKYGKNPRAETALYNGYRTALGIEYSLGIRKSPEELAQIKDTKIAKRELSLMAEELKYQIANKEITPEQAEATFKTTFGGKANVGAEFFSQMRQFKSIGRTAATQKSAEEVLRERAFDVDASRQLLRVAKNEVTEQEAETALREKYKDYPELEAKMNNVFRRAISLDKSTDRAAAKEAETAKYEGMVMVALSGGGIYADPNDKKYKAAASRSFAGMYYDEGKQPSLDDVLSFSKATGVVPDQFVDGVRGAVSSSNTDAVIQGAKSYDALVKANPVFANVLSGDMAQRALFVNSMVEHGVPSKDIADQIKRNESISEETRNQRAEVARRLVTPKQDGTEKIEWKTDIIDTSPAAKREAHDLFIKNYMLYENAETAQQATETQIVNTYRPTVLGESSFGRNTIGLVHSNPSLSPEEVEKWVYEDLAAKYGDILRNTAKLELLPYPSFLQKVGDKLAEGGETAAAIATAPIRLLGDVAATVVNVDPKYLDDWYALELSGPDKTHTRFVLAPIANSRSRQNGSPAYGVSYIDPNTGIPVPLRDEEGQAVVYYVDLSQTPHADRLRQEGFRRARSPNILSQILGDIVPSETEGE